jgi:hypothetical protein
VSSDEIVPGTDLVAGSQCDDCVVPLNLPFPITFYGSLYNGANVSSNGTMQFTSFSADFDNTCLPTPITGTLGATLFPMWDDLRTDVTGTVPSGIYTAVTGTAPNRVLNVEWRACLYSETGCRGTVNFEVRFTEGSSDISFVYGPVSAIGEDATIGVQDGEGSYTEYSCNTPSLRNNLKITWSTLGCGTPAITPVPSPTCTINFSDVHTTDYFYEDVRCVYCLGAVSGYADGTFRPFNNTTRGQMAKIVVLALQIPIVTPTGTPTFNDVLEGSAFYEYVETAAANNIVSGYADGTYRPNNFVTRGQLSKIVVTAANHMFNWQIVSPTTPTFTDVPPGSAFYEYIETVVCHGVVSGYADQTFRPGNNAIRAQIAKIVCRTSQNPSDNCVTLANKPNGK